MAQDVKKKVIVKGLAKAFLSTNPDEEKSIETRTLKKPSSSKDKKTTVRASEIAASIRRREMAAAGIKEIPKEKTAEPVTVMPVAPVVHKLNKVENGTIKKKPACQKAATVKKPADETIAISEKRKAVAEKLAASKNTETSSKKVTKAETSVVEKPVKTESKTEMKKDEVKKPEVKKTEVKKAEAKKAEVKKTEVKKAEAKKAEVKKTEVKKTEVKKPEAKKTETKTSSITYIEYMSVKLEKEDLILKAEKVWKESLGNKISDLKELEIYVKPQDGKVYCVFNKKINDSFDI